jgi:MoaA/NifB/PqqE/SkfB family radical SAM enzyme
MSLKEIIKRHLSPLHGDPQPLSSHAEPELKRRWRLLQVESTIACNLRCIMCPWREIAKNVENQGIMTQKVWEALRPHLPETRSVDFTGGGEPLLQPRLVEWIREAHAAGCETGILTNGLLLTEKKAAQIIDAGLNWICFSMDGATAEIYEAIRVGSNFEKVCQNLANIAALRSHKVPETMINFVLMPMNFHQVEDIVKLAHRLGVDQVNFKQCDVIRGEQGKGYGLFALEKTKEIRRLQKALAKARRLAKKLKIKTTAFSFIPEEQPVCDQDPRNSVFVLHNGAVGPCINLAIGGATTFLGQDVIMPTIHYGRLPDQNLTDLWDTETCKFYRERFESRVRAYDDVVVNSAVGSSWTKFRETLHTAKEAMPEAAEGCKVCHYLYDI